MYIRTGLDLDRVYIETKGLARTRKSSTLKNIRHVLQGCRMVYFQTKNPSLDKFCRVLQWEMFVRFMADLKAIWYFCGLLVYFMVISYIFPRFGIFTKKNLATLLSRKASFLF
jgi:hypothetical protein